MLVWFEIPATDLERATAFYEAVFDITFTSEESPEGQQKSLFPGGIGSIAQGPDWTSSKDGIVVYLDGGDDLQVILDRVVANGGTVVEPKQPVTATQGYWGRFRDTEGNLIGVLSPH
jgi:predicted enzyme related to lactoylglutathione lyase